MKKTVAIVLALVMCVGLFTMTGCKKEEKVLSPYETMNLSEYVTLPDYLSYSYEEPEVNITDDEINAEIEARLNAAATTETITEGTVNKGDIINISFKGTLEDGSTQDGMNSESFKLNLGNANMIEGFQEGIYGATIGKPVTVDLKFPDPYEVNPELAGKPVTFEITVLNKEITVVPKLDEAFVKANSSANTVEEYRTVVKEELEVEKYDNLLGDIKASMFQQILDETEYLKLPEEEVEAEKAKLKSEYENLAKNQGQEWDAFLDSALKMTEEEFEEQLQEYGESVVRQKLVIYATAEKEGVEYTDEEYQLVLDDIIKSAGVENDEQFKAGMGVSVEEYADAYNLRITLLMDKTLGVIYDKLEK